MQSIRGKHAVCVDAATVAGQISGFPHILIDLGTGDGRFVRHAAETSPDTFAIGVDLCADNLREANRRAPANALYLLASAYALPRELQGLATHLTVNFPWGELLTGLLASKQEQQPGLPAAVAALCRPGARLEVRLNAGALSQAGWTLNDAVPALQHNLQAAGFDLAPPRVLDAKDLRAYPTTWSHRLAFGREPCALYFRGLKTIKGW